MVGKGKIKQLIREALSKVHISMDIWTSDFSTYAFLGVNAHFVVRRNAGLQTVSVLLALRRLKERHSGEYEGAILADVVKEYEFADKLGVCVADNAGDNDTAVRALFAQIAPELKDLSGKRVRCLAHIINLAAKAYLYGQDVEAFEEEACQLEHDEFDAEAMQASQRTWRRHGALGKLHNLAVYIRQSAARKEEFRNIVVGDDGVDGKWLNKIQYVYNNRGCDKVPAHAGICSMHVTQHPRSKRGDASVARRSSRCIKGDLLTRRHT